MCIHVVYTTESMLCKCCLKMCVHTNLAGLAFFFLSLLHMIPCSSTVAMLLSCLERFQLFDALVLDLEKCHSQVKLALARELKLHMFTYTEVH